jgi:hypothetical protein
MADPKYPENVSGPFWVECDLCMFCRAPESVAPGLIGFSEAKSHCYFKKQPDTVAELDQAIKAVELSCCGAYHYAGEDEETKRKLKDAGCQEAIDYS